MKIKFSNLGSIQETELDLRPLTVIIGPNNSGKTYIAYSTYGLWQRACRSVSFKQDMNLIKFRHEQEGNWSLTIDDNVLDLFITDAKNAAEQFQGDTLELFFQDSSRKLFSETSFRIIVSREEIEEAINQLTHQDPFVLIDGSLLNFSRKGNILYAQVNTEGINNNKRIINIVNMLENDRKTPPDDLFFFLIREILFYTEIFPFPAERNAFINTYKMLANRRYKLLKQTQRELFNINAEKQLELLKEQGDIRYPKPVEDFLDFLSDIELQEIPKTNSSNKNEFQKLADEIEKQLQNKNKTNLKPTKLGGKEIKILVKKGLEIDIYNASSSIKQLAPLLLYLRYRASKGDFIVIDEPEMNLHPESQAKLLEALSILVNLGVRILLTTHSPYVMAHLDNLVNGNHENPEILKRQCSYLYLQDERAFLHKDKVSAYEMKDNKLVSLHDPDYGIRWDTLSDVSVDIQQKFFQIYEAGQEKAD
jgi:predicted ATPase